MEKLSYPVLKASGYEEYILERAPEKVMQFGEGNFLRAFVDYWFDLANQQAGWNGKCVIIKPRNSPSKVCRDMNLQEGLYTLHLRGMENGKKIDNRRVISSVSRCIDPHIGDGFQQMLQLAVSEDLQYIVSNTTEAGIVYDPACQPEDTPCSSFPGKLTQVLYARFQAGKSGLVILPCELNDNNGDLLRDCVMQYALQWNLGADFEDYLNRQCLFCNTLVDRIVPGRMDASEQEKSDIADGYWDSLRVVSEIFGIWNIEGPDWLSEKLPFAGAGIPCTVVPDITPYKKRKVRILNGAHTSFALGAYLDGFDTVRDAIEDPAIQGYVNKLLSNEIIPTLAMDRPELERFAEAVLDRFSNPFIEHALLSISLNSTAKWRVRNLPTLLDIAAGGELPQCLCMGFAAYIAFYSCNIQALTESGLVCQRPKGNTYICSDDRWVLEFYWRHRTDSVVELVHAVMTNQQMWGMDLTRIDGFETATAANLKYIREQGFIAAYTSCL